MKQMHRQQQHNTYSLFEWPPMTRIDTTMNGMSDDQAEWISKKNQRRLEFR